MLADESAAGRTDRAIITVSSANAFAASPDRAEYCLSKSALSMMTKLFALRLAQASIGAYEIRPGVIRTAMTAVARERYDALYARGDFTPVNRWGEPAEVGRAAAMLAGGHLSFSTGDVIHVDGGPAHCEAVMTVEHLRRLDPGVYAYDDLKVGDYFDTGGIKVTDAMSLPSPVSRGIISTSTSMTSSPGNTASPDASHTVFSAWRWPTGSRIAPRSGSSASPRSAGTGHSARRS